MKISTSMLLGCLLIISCSHNEMISDKTITVFDKQTISFSPDMETDALDNMVSLGSGRLVLKKIQLPKKIIITMHKLPSDWNPLGIHGINQVPFLSCLGQNLKIWIIPTPSNC